MISLIMEKLGAEGCVIFLEGGISKRCSVISQCCRALGAASPGFQEQQGSFVGELVLPYCDRSDWEIRPVIS